MKAFKLLGLVLAFSVSAVFFGCKNNQKIADQKQINVAKTHTVRPKHTTDPNKYVLIGEWSRSGTPVVIKISGVEDNGRLELGYFDPKYINVIKASWLKTGALLSIYIELEDINYPVSTLKLNYVPERDVLVGDFYDAAEDMNHTVEFVRIQ